MKTYLYRAVALEHEDDAFTGEPNYWPGAVIGRQSGYLSRSSAVEAGAKSGVAFKVVRSEPVVFAKDREVEALAEVDRLRERLSQLRDDERPLRVIA